MQRASNMEMVIKPEPEDDWTGAGTEGLHKPETLASPFVPIKIEAPECASQQSLTTTTASIGQAVMSPQNMNPVMMSAGSFIPVMSAPKVVAATSSPASLTSTSIPTSARVIAGVTATSAGDGGIADEKSILNLKNYTKMGPKRGRGRGAAKMSQRGTGRGQVVERPRSPTPSPSEDEAMLVSEPEQPQSHPAGGDHPDITAVARKKRKNKPYFYTTLTDAQKEEVIDWLKDNPSIYAKRLTDYKDSQKKEKLWEDKAADMGVRVADLKTFYKSNRTKMTRIKRTVGKSGDGAETVEDLSATDNWVWEKFSFIKDHIETVERRNVVSIRGRERRTPATATAPGPAVPPPTEDIIQSDSGAESQSTEPSSRRLSTESGDLRRNLMEFMEFMSGKKGGPSTLARHIEEGLAQLPGDIKRATEIKLMEVLHEGQRQAEERQEMLQ